MNNYYLNLKKLTNDEKISLLSYLNSNNGSRSEWTINDLNDDRYHYLRYDKDLPNFLSTYDIQGQTELLLGTFIETDLLINNSIHDLIDEHYKSISSSINQLIRKRLTLMGYEFYSELSYLKFIERNLLKSDSNNETKYYIIDNSEEKTLLTISSNLYHEPQKNITFKACLNIN